MKMFPASLHYSLTDNIHNHNIICGDQKYGINITHKHSNSAQNKGWKLVGHLFKIGTLLASPLEMYSKFVLPNWTLLGHVLKWVGK